MKYKFIQKLLGAAFIIAGIGKFFKFIENPYQVLTIGHAANIDSFLEPYSAWIISNGNFIIALVGITMLTTGLIQFFNYKAVTAASIIQILMLAGFMLYLHRAIPAIFLIDGVFIVGIVFVLRQKIALKKELRT